MSDVPEQVESAESGLVRVMIPADLRDRLKIAAAIRRVTIQELTAQALEVWLSGTAGAVGGPSRSVCNDCSE